MGRRKMTSVRLNQGILMTEEALVGPTPKLDDKSVSETPRLSLAPKPLAEDVAPPPEAQPDVSLRRVTVGDVDRLWDWLREDGDHRLAQWSIDSSVGLHRYLAQLDELMNQGRAAVYAAYWQGTHVGIIGMNMIGTQAQVHIFMSKAVRGPRGVVIVKKGLPVLEALHPGVELVALTDDPKLMHFASRVGLSRTQYIMTREKA